MSTDSQPWFCTTGRFVRSRSGDSTGAHRPSRGSRATFATTTAAFHVPTSSETMNARKPRESASRPVVLLPSSSVFLLRAATGPSLLFSKAARGGRAPSDEPERPGPERVDLRLHARAPTRRGSSGAPARLAKEPRRDNVLAGKALLPADRTSSAHNKLSDAESPAERAAVAATAFAVIQPRSTPSAARSSRRPGCGRC
jgi:hypothetical protein